MNRTKCMNRKKNDTLRLSSQGVHVVVKACGTLIQRQQVATATRI